MRDDTWLHELLDTTWDNYFADVPQDNIVRIRFGRRAKNRLGSIMVDPTEPDVSIITLNGLFRDTRVPEFVVQATLVHELTHYAHGFNSPLERRFRHPHKGGVMRAEFRERGLEDLYLEQKKWLKVNWPTIIRNEFKVRPMQRTVQGPRLVKVPKPFWFLGQ